MTGVHSPARVLFAGLLTLASFQACASAVLPDTPMPNPVVGVTRTLQLLQDQVAEGSREALAAQKGLIASMERKLLSMDAGIWEAPASVDAAITFALSGGPPTVLREAIKRLPDGHSRRNLVFGSLAYLEGRRAEALKFLNEVDVSEMGVGLRAQMAFVQASLLVGSDTRRAMDLLDRVRLEAPGSLLDEASLRRQMLVVRELNDFPRFIQIASEYVRRFQHSVYAGNFRQRLEAALVQFDFGADPSRFEQFAGLLNGFEPAAQRQMYLVAARHLVESGKLQSVLPVAKRLVEISDRYPGDLARAHLYLGAAEVVFAQTYRGGFERLEKVDRALLDEADLRLLKSAISVGATIGKSAISPEKAKKPAGAHSASALGNSQMLKRASDALTGVDELLYK